MTQGNYKSQKKFQSVMATLSRKLPKPLKYTVLNQNHSVKSLEKELCDQAAWHTGYNSSTKFYTALQKTKLVLRK